MTFREYVEMRLPELKEQYRGLPSKYSPDREYKNSPELNDAMEIWKDSISVGNRWKNTPIGRIGFSKRAADGLKRMNIRTLKKLFEYPAKTFRAEATSKRNMGVDSVENINKKLHELGVRVGLFFEPVTYVQKRIDRYEQNREDMEKYFSQKEEKNKKTSGAGRAGKARLMRLEKKLRQIKQRL